MSKYIKEVALVWFVNDVEVRNLTAAHKLSVGEDLKGRVEAVMADAPYCLQRHRNDDRADYDVFRWNDMNDMPKDLGNVTKSGARAHVF